MKFQLLFGIFPYVALLLCALGVAGRWLFPQRREPGKAWLLEILWRSKTWRVGIIGLILGHLGGFFIPPNWLLLWGRVPVRQLVLEAIGVALGVMALLGVLRALTQPQWSHRLSTLDVLLLALLVLQLVSGLVMVVTYRWGSLWSVATLAPYLNSLLRLQPELDSVSMLPFWIRLHLVGAFALVAVLPFCRLSLASVVTPASRLGADARP